MATSGNNPYKSYVETQVATATPEKLLIMLYNGALQRCLAARRAMTEGNREAVHHSLVKAQAIVTEMSASLDLERGGELAEGLERIYDYIYRTLVQANLSQDAHPVEECENLLQVLLESWQEALLNGGPAAEQPESREALPATGTGGFSICG